MYIFRGNIYIYNHDKLFSQLMEENY